MKFNWIQIPVFFLFSGTLVTIFLLFNDSSSAHYEETARLISSISKKSNNGQLTIDFYPNISSDKEDLSYLSKTITETKTFNRQHYIDERTNGHRIRVIANGEGRRDYWFPELPTNPTFIVENTFSMAWGEEHLYENYDLNLMNSTNVYGNPKIKHFFINETDALYLIENNSRFKGMGLADIPGQTMSLHYYDEKNVERTEEWIIGNVILANQLDDALYKSLYTSYIISDYHLPNIHGKISIAFDFSSSETNNANCLNHISVKYSNHSMRFDTRNFDSVDTNSLNNIRDSFYKLSSYNNSNNNKLIIVSFVLGIAVSIFIFIVGYINQRLQISTSIILVSTAFVVYLVFLVLSSIFPYGLISRSFNTISILINVCFALLAVVCNIFSSSINTRKQTNNTKEKDKTV